MQTPSTIPSDEQFRLTSGLKLGPPTLRVRELREVLNFYENDIGLKVKGRKTGPDGLDLTALGFEQRTEPLLFLKHDPSASRPSPDFAGLYHYAVLLPGRKDLASTFLAVGNSGAAYDGYADHSFSEAIYLHDPERNGIEFYADRDRTTWPSWQDLQGRSDGSRRFAALNGPLNFDSLLRELSSHERANPVSFPRGARIGHMHLRVTDLDRSVRFYQSKLGFDVTMHFPEIGAAFLSVGGYHHHLGLNTWHSRGGTPHRNGESGLDEFRIMLPSVRDLAAVSDRFPGLRHDEHGLTVKDPDGIAITFELQSASND